MRKAILMILLAVVSGSAAAAWVEVDSDEATTFYIDPTTIRRDGNQVKMWELHDYNKVEAKGSAKYRSMKAETEYDCKEEQSRGISSSFHSGKMARGRIVHVTSDSGKWRPVPPGGTIEVLWKIACGRGHC